MVIDSLRERQEKVEKKRTEELTAVAKRATASATGQYIDHADLLYDERGLPK